MSIMSPFFMELDRGDRFSLDEMTDDKKNVYETIGDYPDTTKVSNEADEGSHASADLPFALDMSCSAKSVDGTDLAVVETAKNEELVSDHKSSTLPLSSSTLSSTKSDSENSNSGQHNYHNFMGTFDSIRRKFRGLTDSHQKSKPLQESPDAKNGVEKRSKPKSKISERSRSASKTKKLSASGFSRKGSVSREKKIKSLRKGSSQDKENLMMVKLSTSLPTAHSAWKDLRGVSPPTPPLHRLPTVVRWKSC